MKLLFTFLAFVTFGVIHAQNQKTIVIKAIDAETENEISQVFISLKSENAWSFRKSHYEGENIQLPSFKSRMELNIKLSAKDYMSLDTTITLVNRNFRKNNVLEVKLPLTFDGQSMAGVDIYSTYAPRIVFASEEVSVGDFELDNKGTIYLLNYPKTLKKGAYVGILKNNRWESRYALQFKAEQLERDYKGTVYVVGDQKVHIMDYDSKLRFFDMPYDYYQDHIVPIIDTFQNNYYFSDYAEWYPAFDYLCVSKKDTSYTKIHHVEDTEMMEHYLAEYKYCDVRTKLWAWDMERETDIDREIWTGANVFTNSLYYEPPYSPMFLVQEDTDSLLVVCDFYKNQLYKIDPNSNDCYDSLTISFHENKRKSGFDYLIQDPKTKIVYAVFENAGFTTLKTLNTETGELEDPFKLHYRYVEKIRVYEGEVFYIYRPFESIQKKYLYAEIIGDDRKK